MGIEAGYSLAVSQNIVSSFLPVLQFLVIKRKSGKGRKSRAWLGLNSRTSYVCFETFKRRVICADSSARRPGSSSSKKPATLPISRSQKSTTGQSLTFFYEKAHKYVAPAATDTVTYLYDCCFSHAVNRASSSGFDGAAIQDVRHPGEHGLLKLHIDREASKDLWVADLLRK